MRRRRHPPGLQGDRRGVSPVIAEILLVAITVVLVAVLYISVTGILAGTGTVTPVVTFDAPSLTGAPGEWQIIVAGVSTSEPLSAYLVTVLSGSTVLINLTDLAADLSVSESGLTLTFTDIGGPDRLTAGDFFVLSGVASGSTYTLFLIWRSTGDSVGDQTVVA